MKTYKKSAVRVCLLLGASTLLGFLTKKQLTGATRAQSAQISRIPAQGIIENDIGGKVPGDERNGIEDLKQIYSFINIYKERHQGRYPPDIDDLMLDFSGNFQGYGLKQHKAGWMAFFNPDMRYTDGVGAGDMPERHVAYQYSSRRPDGSWIDQQKPVGTRDVFASSMIYVHENVRQLPHERSKSNPVGFYLVLWDDGQVEKIPYHQVLYAPMRIPVTADHPTRKSYKTAFTGQAGLPSGTLRYDQFYRNLGWKNGGPRGTEGGAGVSYLSTS